MKLTNPHQILVHNSAWSCHRYPLSHFPRDNGKEKRSNWALAHHNQGEPEIEICVAVNLDHRDIDPEVFLRQLGWSFGIIQPTARFVSIM